ncbi:MAG: recombinase family protein [Anaerolineae bacterium]|nr:recombinase family protein [Anaerolineae bacterium]
MDTNKLAVVYVRVSTKLQIDNYSVQDQRDLTHLAERYGFGRVEVREEQGASAETITARPVMKRLLDEVSQGRIGAIIVASFTRLTRDIDDIDGKIIKKTCRDEDCVIITPEKLYDFSNETDDDLADLQFFFSKIQKRMNLKPMVRGLYTKAKSGGFIGVPLSFGYDFTWREEDGPKGRRFVADLVINEEEAAVVRYIHDTFPTMYYRQLALHLKDLVAQGKMMPFPIKRSSARKNHGADTRGWSYKDIQYIITNDIYLGRLQYAVHVKSAYLRGLDPIYTYRDDLRILPDDVWERNQQLVAVRQRISPQSKASPHLYSGVLRCPNCRGPLSGKNQRTSTRPEGGYITYQCAAYSLKGPRVCTGYFLPERCVTEVVLPTLTELIQVNLRDYLSEAVKADPLHSALEGEVKTELAKVNQSIKNLIEAVKVGALNLDDVREENAQLQESKERLQRRLANLKDSTRMTDELRAILKVFDTDLDRVLTDLTEDRLRFNTFIRLFFSSITVEADRPGKGWSRGLKPHMKGEQANWNPRITQFTLEPKFEAFVQQTGFRLPEALRALQAASDDYPTDPNSSAFM